MSFKNPIVIALAVLAVLIVVWLLYPKSEEDRIRQRLDELAHVVSTTEQQRDAARLIHIAGLQQFFSEDVTVAIRPNMRKVTGRSDLLKAAHFALQQEPGMTVAFEDMTVTHDAGTRHAVVNTTLIVTGVQSQHARSFDAQELEMDLVKADGEWVIKTVRPVEAIKLDY
jgi:hypothetical protein